MEGYPNGAPFSSKEHVILDAKPLRSLAPMFPESLGINTISPPGARPFVYITPVRSFASGSASEFPPGFSPLLPTFPTTQARAPISTNNGTDNDPLFRTPVSSSGRKSKKPLTPSSSDLFSYESESTEGKKAKRKYTKKPYSVPIPLCSPRHATESVEVVLMTFDALRRRILQLDEAKGLSLNRRPDLKAGSIMMNNILRANNVKRMGHVPGVEIGDHFYFRVEMCLVGLHYQGISGIDYMTAKFNDGDDPVALSIVSAGAYENDEGDLDVLVYSGQGGGGGGGGGSSSSSKSKSDKKQGDDQKLERGNLALERSLHRGNVIRVIRSEKDLICQKGKMYIYDGLYKIHESWVEKGKAGFNVFKHKLLREPGQADGIGLWKMTHKWKENPSSRGDVISHDYSSGLEKKPICLFNDVDDEKRPRHFTYATKVTYLTPTSSTKTSRGCMCQGECLPTDGSCYCTQRNGGYHPYNLNDLLVIRKPLVYECGVSCKCSTNCRNRMTQRGIKLHFEIFRTRDRGWGLRSWDPIRAGSFICEYIGEVIEKVKVGENGEEDDDYVFRMMRADDTQLKWNYVPELLGETVSAESNETSKPLPIIISAKRMGNISRFMNHSCSPNVFWQPVQHDHDGEGYPRIMFFAIKHIPPMTELMFDYGTNETEVGIEEMGSSFRPSRRKKCLCGSLKCRGYFG